MQILSLILQLEGLLKDTSILEILVELHVCGLPGRFWTTIGIS